MIHKNGTVFQEYLVKSGRENGIKIDIFVIESTYDNPLRRVWHGICCEAGLFLLSCYRMYLWREEFHALAAGNKKAEFVIRLKEMIGRMFASKGGYWYDRVERCLMRCTKENSRYVAIPSGRGHFWGELYKRETFLQTVPMQFEDKIMPVTADYDHYLQNLYGKYMELPPESAREHHIIYDVKV